MPAFKIATLFLVLLLIQSIYTKPWDKTAESSDEGYSNPRLVVMSYIAEKMVILGDELFRKAASVSRDILKDGELISNLEPEVSDFKHNLTLFVDQYDPSKDRDELNDIFEIFSKTMDHYFELPEDEVTEESKFILEILNKYHVKDLAMEFAKACEPYMENFKTMFEENLKEYSQDLLDWFENFKSLSDSEEKLDAFERYFVLTMEQEMT